MMTSGMQFQRRALATSAGVAAGKAVPFTPRPAISSSERSRSCASICSTSSSCSSSQQSRAGLWCGRRSASAAVCSAVVDGKLISSTEVPAFIMRDDMMDQLHRWTMMEAQESGMRNFGAPMSVKPNFKNDMLWGFDVSIYREGVRLTDIGVMFDDEEVKKHEFVGRDDETGMPLLEGRTDIVKGKNIEIWKMDSIPVDEDLRSTIRSYCTGLVAALNRYYAFGSVFVDDAQ